MTKKRNKNLAENGKMLSTEQEQGLRKRVARAIRWRSAESGKPEKEVGAEVGATPEMTSKWANEHQTPTPPYLRKMVEAWPINGHWLLTGEGPMLVQPPDVARPSVETMEGLREWIDRVLPTSRALGAAPSPEKLAAWLEEQGWTVVPPGRGKPGGAGGGGQ